MILIIIFAFESKHVRIMNALPTISISDLLRNFALYDNYQDKVVIAELNYTIALKKDGNKVQMSPARLNALTFFLIFKGYIKLEVDYYPYTLHSDNFLTLMPTHIFQVKEISEDFKGKLLVMDLEFLHDVRSEHINPSLANYMEIKKHPVVKLYQSETRHLDDYLHVIKEKIHEHMHFFHKEIILLSFFSFLMELVNIMIGKKENIPVQEKKTRKEIIVNEFLELLINHCKEEHDVSFYSEKLSITSQYLSLVLKETTGITANAIIDRAIMSEAKILLRSQRYSIQQIADILNFSDQSSFGKFFKKHTGLSPQNFKKEFFSNYK